MNTDNLTLFDQAETAKQEKKRPGNTRVTGKEQYYTPPSIAIEIMQNLSDEVPNLDNRTVLEPAGGTGNFIEAAKSLGVSNFISFDIEPHHPQVQLGSFLDQELSETGLITVSNPPFGRNNSLSIPFFNHAAKYSDVIAYIVPRSWRKWTVLNRLDRNFHLFRDDNLDTDYVDETNQLLSNKGMLRTCIQYWKREEFLRPIIKVTDTGIIERCKFEEADASLTIFGYGCGTIKTDFPRKSNTTQMFLKLKHPKALEAFQNSDFSKFFMNTAYTEALSIQEINYVLNEYIHGDPLFVKGL